jgi:citrate synthase
MTDTVRELVARTLKIPVSEATDDLQYQSVSAWDSLKHVELMLVLEQALGVRIDADQVLQLSSIARIREFVEQRPDRASAAAAAPADRARREGPPVHRGLNNVYFDRSEITQIDGEAGRLLHRGYAIEDLAEHCRFEEVAHLLLRGRLPARPELAAFEAELKAARFLPAPVVELVQRFRDAPPTDVLRTAASALGALDPDRHVHDPAAEQRKGVRLVSQLPMVVGAHARARAGLAPAAPDPGLGHAAHCLHQLTGQAPPPWAAEHLDRDLILHADHGSNASAFTARVVTGTEADLHAAVTAAIAAFSGPLHGGAIGDVRQMIAEVGEPENAAAYVRRKLEAGQPVMGFGHRVYRTEDPRARFLREGARRLSAALDRPQAFAVLEAVVEAMAPYCRHGLAPNVDQYGGVIYHLLGIPDDLAVPFFIVGRTAGWVAQVVEQRRSNILIRPRLQYVGPGERRVVPLEHREPAGPPAAAGFGSL